MLGLNDRIKKASSYKGADFDGVDGIGIICRGPSVYRIDLCYNKFNCCYLSGEFNNSLLKIGKYINGKNVVLCTMQNDRYRTSVDNCKKYNIMNIQVPYQNGTKEYRDCIEKFSDLKVVGIEKEHYDILKRMNGGSDCKAIPVTGIFPLLSALYYNPRNIYIIGMDFYNRSVKPYYVREEMDVVDYPRIYGSSVIFRKMMIDVLINVCESFVDTNIYLYTTYKGVKNHRNLHVFYV